MRRLIFQAQLLERDGYLLAIRGAGCVETALESAGSSELRFESVPDNALDICFSSHCTCELLEFL